MPTDVLKVSGDYLIDASNGNITLDVTNDTSTGTVTIIGNLNVVGTSTNVATINSVLQDNIIILNSGETANTGITLGTAGILISRGNNNSPSAAATILYDETTNSGKWIGDDGSTHKGIFTFNSANAGSAIQANAIRIDTNTTSTLNILGADNGDAMINVKGQVDYWTRVVHDDDIPNKKYVDQALYLGTDFAKRVQVGGTFLRVSDSSVQFTDPPYYGPNRIFAALGTSTNEVFSLEGTSAIIQGITINNSEITVNTSTDLVLQPTVGYGVVIKESLKLGEISTSTTVTAEANIDTLYYTGVAGGGGTGLYYVNTQQSDELVSRRKAIIYGIIF